MKSTAATLAAIFGYAAAQNAYGASTTAPASYPSTTAACPAPGTTGSDGRYSCNPAHQYPENQFCVESDGCYYLVKQGPGVTATPSSTATAPAYPSSTSACPAPGTNGPDGRYSCNPAHQYPENQFCILSDGCYYLVNQGPGVSATPSGTAPSYPTASASCPAPGTNGTNGYSCNPAHQYPEGQQCQLVNGCYVLTQPGPGVSAPAGYPSKPVTTVVSSFTTVCPSPTTITQNGKTYPVTSATTLTITHCPGGCTITQAPPAPTSTGSSCPAPGATDSMGRYSCNPAHSYPAGQTCVLVNGCYFLVKGSVSSGVVPPTSMYVMPSASGKTNGTATASMPVQYTGAAAIATAAPVMAVAALAGLFL
ncbi:Vacuole-localized protein 4 [Pseudocercospora fuligena]|uniref:Vacuole-localized protein 4 n=1 Tax=Pseudocercospora fuligena TaxID=685502 RepID=A0A8H6RBT5_9PEZI|nr:Vacuole-localized protein 4 [Pseudocercospora fuligena]